MLLERKKRLCPLGAFYGQEPNLKWVSDITYLPTSEGWLYLAVVLDLFSRRIVGWAMGTSLEASLPVQALEMARISRKPCTGLLHHSDRGVQRPRPKVRFMVKTICESRVSNGSSGIRWYLEYEQERKLLG